MSKILGVLKYKKKIGLLFALLKSFAGGGAPTRSSRPALAIGEMVQRVGWAGIKEPFVSPSWPSGCQPLGEVVDSLGVFFI